MGVGIRHLSKSTTLLKSTPVHRIHNFVSLRSDLLKFHIRLFVCVSLCTGVFVWVCVVHYISSCLRLVGN